MLGGTHVLLRILESRDLEFVRHLRNAPHVNNWFIDRHFINDLQQQQFFRNSTESRSAMYFVVESLPKNEACGVFMIQHIDHRNQRATVGHFFSKGTDALAIYEAGHLAYEYAFGYLNLHKITAEVLADNQRAIRFSESIGMVREACRKQHVFSHGRMADVLEFALFRDDFWCRPTKIVKFLRAGYAVREAADQSPEVEDAR